MPGTLTGGAASVLRPELEARLRRLVQEALKCAAHSGGGKGRLTCAHLWTAHTQLWGAAHTARLQASMGVGRVPQPGGAAGEAHVDRLEVPMCHSMVDLLGVRSVDTILANAALPRESLTLLRSIQHAVRAANLQAARRVLLAYSEEAASPAVRNLFPAVISLLASEQQSCIADDAVARHAVLLHIVLGFIEHEKMPVESETVALLGIVTTAVIHRARDSDPAASAVATPLLSTTLEDVRVHGKAAAASGVPAKLQPLMAKHSAGGVWQNAAASISTQIRFRALAVRALTCLLQRVSKYVSAVRLQAAAVLLQVLLAPKSATTAPAYTAGAAAAGSGAPPRTTPRAQRLDAGDELDAAIAALYRQSQSSAAGGSTDGAAIPLTAFRRGTLRVQPELPVPSASIYGAVTGLAAVGMDVLQTTVLPLMCRWLADVCAVYSVGTCAPATLSPPPLRTSSSAPAAALPLAVGTNSGDAAANATPMAGAAAHKGGRVGAHSGTHVSVAALRQRTLQNPWTTQVLGAMQRLLSASVVVMSLPAHQDERPQATGHRRLRRIDAQPGAAPSLAATRSVPPVPLSMASSGGSGAQLCNGDVGSASSSKAAAARTATSAPAAKRRRRGRAASSDAVAHDSVSGTSSGSVSPSMEALDSPAAGVDGSALGAGVPSLAASATRTFTDADFFLCRRVGDLAAGGTAVGGSGEAVRGRAGAPLWGEPASSILAFTEAIAEARVIDTFDLSETLVFSTRPASGSLLLL